VEQKVDIKGDLTKVSEFSSTVHAHGFKRLKSSLCHFGNES
jgi:hypothetical protein